MKKTIMEKAVNSLFNLENLKVPMKDGKVSVKIRHLYIVLTALEASSSLKCSDLETRYFSAE